MLIAGTYCGMVESVGVELAAGGVPVVGAALCEVVGMGSARGASGTVVMALSGFSR
jgi:hypothetical protein